MATSLPLRVDVITLLPEVFAPYWAASIIGRAVAAGLLDLRAVQLRDFATDSYGTADDCPYGGGVGMVLKADPIAAAVESVRDPALRAQTIVMSAAGEPLTGELARELAGYDHLVIVCGRYEAVDERVSAVIADREVSVGDYVLTGGELPALLLTDAVARFRSGVLGGEDAAETESFVGGLLEYPHYTRPPLFRGSAVPEVLLSGDHEAISSWRRAEGLRRTWERRPELLARTRMSRRDLETLDGHWAARREKEIPADRSARRQP